MTRADQLPGAGTAPRRVKCVGGPLNGERCAVPPGGSGVIVPLPPSVASPGAREAVYRLQRRRHGRGPAFDVLVHVRNRLALPATAGSPAPRERDATVITP